MKGNYTLYTMCIEYEKMKDASRAVRYGFVRNVYARAKCQSSSQKSKALYSCVYFSTYCKWCNHQMLNIVTFQNHTPGQPFKIDNNILIRVIGMLIRQQLLWYFTARLMRGFYIQHHMSWWSVMRSIWHEINVQFPTHTAK